MPNQTILLIDYEPKSIEKISRPLEDAGYEVQIARDGQAGIEAFEGVQPDLVLVEAMLPKKHGFDVCREIKNKPEGQDTPVLITTGVYRGTKYRREAVNKYGCDEYIEKPISDDDLLEICNRFLTPEESEAAAAEEVAGVTSEPEAEAAPADAVLDLEHLSEGEIIEKLDALLESIGEGGGEPMEVVGPEEEEQASPAEPRPEEPVADQACAEPEPAGVAGEPELDPEEAVEAAFQEPAASEVDAPEESVEAGDPHEEIEAAEETVGAVEMTAPDEAPDEVPYVAGEAEDVPDVEPPETAEPPEAVGAVEDIEPAEVTEPDPAMDPAETEETAESLEEAEAEEEEAVVYQEMGPAVTAARSSRLPLYGGIATAAVVVLAVSLFLILGGGETAETGTAVAPAETPVAADPDGGATVSAFDLLAENDGSMESGLIEAESGNALEAIPAPVRGDAVEPPAPAVQPEPETVAETPAPVLAEVMETAVPETEATDPVVGPAEPASAQPEPVTALPAATETAEPAPGESLAAAEQPEPLPVESFLLDPVVETEPAVPEAADGVAAEETEPVVAQPEPEPAYVPAGEGDLVDLDSVDLAPVPLKQQSPLYHPLARQLGQEGTVVMRLLIDEQGLVEEVEFVSGIPGSRLNLNAIRAAKKWKYEPAVKDGVPVKVWKTEAITFKL